jgi:hypothetical protein
VLERAIDAWFKSPQSLGHDGGSVPAKLEASYGLDLPSAPCSQLSVGLHDDSGLLFFTFLSRSDPHHCLRFLPAGPQSLPLTASTSINRFLGLSIRKFGAAIFDSGQTKLPLPQSPLDIEVLRNRHSYGAAAPSSFARYLRLLYHLYIRGISPQSTGFRICRQRERRSFPDHWSSVRTACLEISGPPVPGPSRFCTLLTLNAQLSTGWLVRF